MLYSQSLALIDLAVADLLTIYQVDAPPIPVELMLQRPKAGLWEAADPNELTNSAGMRQNKYTLRMSVSRLLARSISLSQWGHDHNLSVLEYDKEALRAFARAILMPRKMLEQIYEGIRTPPVIAMRFQVPAEDAQLRLLDLGYAEVNSEP
ncbi:MAG: hypothetical protein KF716_12505 [Anaerolineae bacterium]|nr:hypothetical protein [Anaerolineae bacterium]